MLEWDEILDTQLPVLGYSLKVNDGFGGKDFVNVFAQIAPPNVRSYLVSNLITGREYDFTIQASNFNGAGEASYPTSFIICTAPKELAAAQMTSYTQNTMELTWLAPNITGGCPVLSYSIYLKD